MPVTARLSKKFYDTFGEDLAQEMVDWFNQVDATYRADLRELNELNFARFDAKLEQRLVELEAKLEQRMLRLEAKIAALEAKLEQRLADLEARMIAGVRTEIAAARADMIKWMFVFWLGTVGTFLAVVSLLVS